MSNEEFLILFQHVSRLTRIDIRSERTFGDAS